MSEKCKGRAAGGVARAESLSPERRAEIAKKAAEARWGNRDVAEATMDGTLKIGDAEIPCFVLQDETRVLARAAFVRAIGRKGKVKGGREYDGEFQTPVFLSASNLKPFINRDIDENSKPVIFRWNGIEMIGYRAELLPDVCDVYQDAERAGVLRSTQYHIAEACRILGRGLTRVGIIGLVDEATGYQKHRAVDALAQILEKFIAKELRPWVQTFPDEFYTELYRLRGLPFPPDTVKRPGYFGHLTNDIVYRRLAPGVLQELKEKTPKGTTGRHKHQLHRRLSGDIGHPKLIAHLDSVVTVMKLTDDGDYDGFIEKMNRVKPRFNETLELPFPMDEGTED